MTTLKDTTPTPAPRALTADQLCKTPLIEELAPTSAEWESCEVVGDQYDLIKRRIRRAFALAVELESHPDDIAVDRFFTAMKSKLAKKRDDGRGGWDDKDECSAEFLSLLLREHVEKGDPIDVANFCMMLHQRGEMIAPAPAPQMRGDE